MPIDPGAAGPALDSVAITRSASRRRSRCGRQPVISCSMSIDPGAAGPALDSVAMIQERVDIHEQLDDRYTIFHYWNDITNFILLLLRLGAVKEWSLVPWILILKGMIAVNSAIKTMLLIYILVFLTFVYVDVSVVNEAGMKIKRSLDRAIDAGIIYGTIEDDYSKGRIRLDEAKVREGTEDIFRKNLSLDASLSNDAYKNGNLVVSVSYHNGSPRVTASYKADIKLVAGHIVGLETYDMEVKRQTPYLSDYK